jgi:hypothetical protein
MCVSVMPTRVEASCAGVHPLTRRTIEQDARPEHVSQRRRGRGDGGGKRCGCVLRISRHRWGFLGAGDKNTSHKFADADALKRAQ